MPLLARLALPLAVAWLTWRAEALTTGGAFAAAAVGALAMGAGLEWGAYLLLWFAAASLLSRWGRTRKAARTAGVVAKGDRRDAAQVLANGGVFGAAAALALLTGGARGAASPAAGGGAIGTGDPATVTVNLATFAAVAAAGTLAAAAADTWATEIGTLTRGRAWSLRTRRAVPAGISGAVTLPGSAAMLLGAVAHAALAAVLGLVPLAAAPAVAAGGVAGAVADTLLGAWAQARRRCPRCDAATERAVHDCGGRTVPAGGLGALDNDGVNALCTLVGAAVAVGVALAAGVAGGEPGGGAFPGRSA